MWRGLGLALGGALVLLGAAACGGGGGSSETYTLSATKSCLQKAGYSTAALANRYLPGAGGNLRVQLSQRQQLLAPGATPGREARGYVFLVFQKDPAAAQKTQDKAVTLAVQALRGQYIQATRASVERGVGLSKNVFFYSSTGSLTSHERKQVEACLR
jgi:hypothetical protein